MMFLESEGGDLEMIYLHEEQYNHLYRVTHRASQTQETQITTGDWSVTSLLTADKDTVYFHAQINHVQQHLYKTKSSGGGEVVRLTLDGFFHRCTINNSKTQFASVYSNSQTHYQCGIFCLETGQKLKTITRTLNFGEVYLKKTSKVPDVGASTSDQITMFRYDTPILDSIEVEGHVIHYMLYPAKGVDLSQPQPVLLNVYGGPAIQLVVDRSVLNPQMF